MRLKENKQYSQRRTVKENQKIEKAAAYFR